MRYAREAYDANDTDGTVQHVVEHISSCCSETDSPSEFAEQIDVQFQPVRGHPERVLIVGTLHGHNPTPYYFGEEEPERNKHAKVREPVDLTPAQLQAHLIRKAGL